MEASRIKFMPTYAVEDKGSPHDLRATDEKESLRRLSTALKAASAEDQRAIGTPFVG